MGVLVGYPSVESYEHFSTDDEPIRSTANHEFVNIPTYH